MATWARWDRGEITRDELIAAMTPLRLKTERLLRWTAAGAPGHTARQKAAEILPHSEALWRFLEDERVPPTNTLAERLLRYAVIWRKLSSPCAGPRRTTAT
jgi:hypothetical protein